MLCSSLECCLVFALVGQVLGSFPKEPSHWVSAGPANASVPLAPLGRVNISVLEANVIQLDLAWIDSSGYITAADRVTVSNTSHTTEPIRTRVWPFNVYMGVEYMVSQPRVVSQAMIGASTLQFVTTSPMLSSEVQFDSVMVHRLVFQGATNLSYSMYCETPKAAVEFYFTRAELAVQPLPLKSAVGVVTARRPPINSTQAVVDNVSLHSVFNLNLTNAWALNTSDFQFNALAISLQGLANSGSGGPRLYLTYPEGWAFSYTAIVKDYLQSRHDIPFQQSGSALDVLTALMHSGVAVKGYILWNPDVRESLVVAYTAAGVKDAIVATSDMEADLQALGLRCLEDLRHQFDGQNPVQIYSWAKQMYWQQCSKDYIIWLGGECHNAMQPGVADWGISRKGFFTDLSTIVNTTSDSEYSLAYDLIGDLNPAFTVMGWHSYCKDYEHTFTALASRHGGRVHGLDTNPNLSFTHKVPVSKGFEFTNRHSNNTDVANIKDKVYITLVQTDGLGLGSWVKPGRGSIPYAWEVTLPDLEIQPVLLQMFYEQATHNDFFVAALSGPGYMYPRATPPELLPGLLSKAADAMSELDLHSLVIFDASNATGPHTVTEDTTLPAEIVDAYMKAMPKAQGFLNGYAPTFTFDHRENPNGNQSLLSFDYYLDPGRSVDEAVLDLNQLAALNPKRPYFLPIHVREFSTIGKVADILKLLDNSTFEVIAVDKWFTWANYKPSCRNRFK